MNGTEKPHEYPLFGPRTLFYLVLPSETTFKSHEEVPDYIDRAVPYFLSLLALEVVIGTWRGVGRFRLNDSLSNLISSTLMRLVGWYLKSTQLWLYLHLYERFKVPWIRPDSTLVWIWAFLLMDLMYYWFHRASHEISVVWAVHQMHHSSEDYNLSTALRQGVVQPLFSWLFYLPFAPVLPPPVFFVHYQFNTVYQFWIHTEQVDKLPWLVEFIFNTASHHRVHHGRNPYCIDTNYGGTLIIWDRLFRTFQAEDEKVSYGLVSPVNSWNPIYLQTFYVRDTVRKASGQETWSDCLRALFYGPGWYRGSPRTGRRAEIPSIDPRHRVYDAKPANRWQFYILLKSAVMIGLFIVTNEKELSVQKRVALHIATVITLQGLGQLMDHKPGELRSGSVVIWRCAFQWQVWWETLRCTGLIILTLTYMCKWTESRQEEVIAVALLAFQIATTIFALHSALGKSKTQ